MTTPSVDLSAIIPLKYKTWVTLIGSLLTLVGPSILQAGDYLPAPWPLVIGLAFALLTTLGVYRAPYKPAGTVLAVDPSAPVVSDKVPTNAPVARPSDVGPVVPPPVDGRHENPWKKK